MGGEEENPNNRPIGTTGIYRIAMDGGKEAGLLWALYSFSVAATNNCPNLSGLKQHKWTVL